MWEDEMEVVVLLVAIAGAALLAVPRVQRRKAGRARTRKAAVAATAVPASSAASWTPPAEPEADAWEDDLGWEGEPEAAPEARSAWEDWRSQSFTAEPPAGASAAEADELPSVERWRAAAEQDDEAWVEDDDDGLGWEGEDDLPVSRPSFDGDDAPPRGFSPTPASGWSGSPDFRDWSGAAEPPALTTPDAAPAFATAAATDVPAASASDVQPEAGRTITLDEDAWDPPLTRTWGASADKRTAAAATPVGTRPSGGRRRVHPVLLVALYAAAGIGLVVLVSTVLLGGSSSDKPKPTVRATATPTATAAATVDAAQPSATATPQATPTPDPAIAAAALADAKRERTRAARAHKAALAHAVAARKRAVHKARAQAKKRREQQQRQSNNNVGSTSGSGAGAGAGGGGQTTTPQTSNSAPAQSNPRPAATPKPRPACEFCIG
jgi:hypothetical protein